MSGKIDAGLLLEWVNEHRWRFYDGYRQEFTNHVAIQPLVAEINSGRLSPAPAPEGGLSEVIATCNQAILLAIEELAWDQKYGVTLEGESRQVDEALRLLHQARLEIEGVWNSKMMNLPQPPAQKESPTIYANTFGIDHETGEDIPDSATEPAQE